MDLSTVFTDDQLAIVGCFAAMGFCGLIAAISFHFGPAGKTSQGTSSSSVPFEPAARQQTAAQDRKAA